MTDAPQEDPETRTTVQMAELLVGFDPAKHRRDPMTDSGQVGKETHAQSDHDDADSGPPVGKETW